VGGDAWLGSLDGGEDDGERQADRRYEGERDVRGEVGELCGSGAERKEAGARGKNRAEEAEPRAVKPREPKFLRTKFVLHFILFRSREDKEWRDSEEDFAATTVWGAASTTPFLTGSTTSY
jgi:hypothetical protein